MDISATVHPIERLVQRMFHFDDTFFTPENVQKPLLSSPWNFDSIMLVYLFLELEKQLGYKVASHTSDISYDLSIKKLIESYQS